MVNITKHEEYKTYKGRHASIETRTPIPQKPKIVQDLVTTWQKTHWGLFVCLC
jgi:hypothetical protein